MAATATNTTPTTSQVHAPGSRCCLFVFIIGRQLRNALEMAAPEMQTPGHPSAAKIGRIRALTPRLRRAVPSWRLRAERDPSHKGGQMARPAPFVYPLNRGDFGQPWCIDREMILIDVRCRSRIGRTRDK